MLTTKKISVFLFLIVSLFTFGEQIQIPNLPDLPPIDKDEIPELPQLPTEDKQEQSGKIRKLLRNTTVMLQSKVEVSVPLQIMSDVDIETMVVDEQKLEIPFDIELNKEPDIKDYYKIKYSENNIDIDNDGQVDTVIYSPPYLNTKIVEDNIVYIDGGKISKEGTHKRKVYMTIEVKE